MLFRLKTEDLHIDFLGMRKNAAALSAFIILAGLVAFIAMGGLNYGIDFRGGTLVQVRIQGAESISAIRDVLLEGNIESFSLQTFGSEDDSEYLVTLRKVEQTKADGETGAAQQVERVLRGVYDDLEVRRVESVGPRVGEELKVAALQAIFFSLIAILLYIWFRFQWRFGIGAVVAVLHDVLVVLAAFVITQKEISLPVVAAILTVAGYSINDTIVIFDRIRENLQKFQKKPVTDVFNESLVQTLNRTLLTSGTTLFVVLAIFIFGGSIISDFAFALLIGVIVGTYSSLFIASPMVFWLRQLFPPRIH